MYCEIEELPTYLVPVENINSKDNFYKIEEQSYDMGRRQWKNRHMIWQH